MKMKKRKSCWLENRWIRGIRNIHGGILRTGLSAVRGINVRPYQKMFRPASVLASENIKPTIAVLNMDYEIIMYRPFEPESQRL